MQDNSSLTPSTKSSSSLSRWLPTRLTLPLLLIAVILAGGRVGWWAWSQLASPSNGQDAQVEPANGNNNSDSTGTSTPLAAPLTTTAVKVYLLDVNDTNFALIPVTLKVETPDEPAAILDAAFDQLLDQTLPETPAFSEIPDGTTLLDLAVKDDGVHVNLSASFEQGGGSASMTGRLGQIIYTATSLEPADPVWISIEGAPLELLGGEGLEVSQPVTRNEFDQNFPM